MKIMKLGWVLIALLALGPAGCGRIEHHTTFPENKPIALGPNLGPDHTYILLHPFVERDRQIYLLFHWIPLNQANGMEAAEKHLNEGDGIVNLRLRTYFGPVDLFFTAITAGIISTYTIDTYGDIVRLSAVPPKT